MSVPHLDIGTFAELCSQTLNAEDYPLASGMAKNVLLYDGHELRAGLNSNSFNQDFNCWSPNSRRKTKSHNCKSSCHSSFIRKPFYKC